MKIEHSILKILSNCKIKGNVIFLPDNPLERKRYLAINKHLENLGGKWNRKAKGHVFDADPSDSFENMLLTGETTDFKKEFQFFETPPELADKMVKMLNISKKNFILEPSAGKGALLDAIFATDPYSQISTMAIEINEKNVNFLKKNQYAVLNHDFLQCNHADIFDEEIDRIIMNPPFTKQQDIDHILHAYSLLVDGGILVSVVSESSFFRENKKSVKFREFLDKVNAEVIMNQEEAFKASGTMVRTRLIKIIK